MHLGASPPTTPAQKILPLATCLQVMRNAGYDGPLSIEFEGIEEPLEGIALGLEYLRRLTSSPTTQ